MTSDKLGQINRYNQYVNQLLELSRSFREDPGKAQFTIEELQLIHKSAYAFDEIVHNIRMGRAKFLIRADE